MEAHSFSFPPFDAFQRLCSEKQADEVSERPTVNQSTAVVPLDLYHNHDRFGNKPLCILDSG
jgi:hypothetical protein